MLNQDDLSAGLIVSVYIEHVDAHNTIRLWDEDFPWIPWVYFCLSAPSLS